MIFKIPLANGKNVFMHGENNDYVSIIIVDGYKFWDFWDETQKHDRVPKSPLNTNYFQDTSEVFAQSDKYPVPLSFVGGPFDYSPNIITFKLVDGITRLQWLFDNGSKSFPVYVSLSTVEWFTKNVGA